MAQITIIATSHIAKESAKEIEEKFESFNPDIIAIELDRNRYVGLTTDAKPSIRGYFRVGFLGGLFALVASAGMKYLGKGLGIKPGVDMRKGIDLAKQHNRELALIDQDISITLRKISNLPFRKKLSLMKKLFIPKKHNIEKFDLNKVPDAKTIENMMKFFKAELPDLYLILVHERNIVMANNLINLVKKNPDKKIMVIIGAGHKEGLIELLQNGGKARYAGGESPDVPSIEKIGGGTKSVEKVVDSSKKDDKENVTTTKKDNTITNKENIGTTKATKSIK